MFSKSQLLHSTGANNIQIQSLHLQPRLQYNPHLHPQKPEVRRLQTLKVHQEGKQLQAVTRRVQQAQEAAKPVRLLAPALVLVTKQPLQLTNTPPHMMINSQPAVCP